MCVLRLCCSASTAPIEGLTQTQQPPHRRKERKDRSECEEEIKEIQDGINKENKKNN